MSSKKNGEEGEAAAVALLRYDGYEIIGKQVVVCGHVIDIYARHPTDGEALVEVKVWATVSGTDTVLKALGHAYDLRECGNTIPYVLILSKRLGGLYGDMLERAVKAGVIRRVRILGFLGDDE